MEKKPLYYIQTIGGYKNKNELLKAIGEYNEAGFVVAVDASNKERIYSPQTKSGSWSAVLIKVNVVKEETWEGYKKRVRLLLLGVSDDKAKKVWEEQKLSK